MSEKKNVIEIPVPEGYERCEPIEATHVLIDCSEVAELLGELDEYKWVFDPLYPGERYINTLRSRLTAYLREVPKPEPFRVVKDSCFVLFSEGSPREVSWPVARTGLTLTVSAGDLGGLAGNCYRVTIEEVLPNE